MTSRYFLGVDGGQSSTVAVIGDGDGRIAGTGHGGPCNHVSTEEARRRFAEAIGGAVVEAIAKAYAAGHEIGAAGGPEFEAACLGLSGGPADKDALARELIRARRYLITDDAAIALAGATGGSPGVVVIAGTGSIASGRNSAGKTARAGGWGYIFGDEGSAFDLARQALRAVLRHEEGWGAPTLLRERLLEAAGAPDANTLLHWCYTPEFPRTRVASWARIVDEAAQLGDAAAREILNGGAQALASYAGAVRAQLFHDSELAQVAYSGGVFESAILRDRFIRLIELSGNAMAAAPVYDAARGALLEAYRLAGIDGAVLREMDV